MTNNALEVFYTINTDGQIELLSMVQTVTFDSGLLHRGLAVRFQAFDQNYQYFADYETGGVLPGGAISVYSHIAPTPEQSERLINHWEAKPYKACRCCELPEEMHLECKE